MLLLYCFNSTMVRLKEDEYFQRLPIERMFQFHNGSIKSRHAEADSADASRFQFHNGSIKR